MHDTSHNLHLATRGARLAAVVLEPALFFFLGLLFAWLGLLVFGKGWAGGIDVSGELLGGVVIIGLGVVQILSNDWVAQRVLVKKPFSQFIKNASNVNRLEHIYRGNATGGWRYYPTRRPGATISNKVMRANGVYKADVEFTVNGQIIRKKSTFFPDDMSEEEVANAINQAYMNIMKDKAATFVPGSRNSYRFKANGIELELYIEDGTNKIISAFPAETVFNGF